MAEDSFCKRMRKSTRDVHAISDHLVNLKLAFALRNNEVWADGLLVFYEIFRWLEENIPSIQELFPVQLLRTEGFEADLSYYLGLDFKKNYEPRQEVSDYLKHLERVKRDNPVSLLAYVYHLYMGLLSGGQILQKKRSLVSGNSTAGQGMMVTSFTDYTISELKSKIRSVFEELALTWDNETKESILSEGRKVFELNNRIIGSVKNVNRVNLTQLGYFILIVLSFVVCIVMWNL